MPTVPAHVSPGAAHCTMLLVASATIVFGLTSSLPAPSAAGKEELEGRAPTPLELQPGIEAAFPRESYAPGATASLVFFNGGRGVTLQVFQIGSEQAHTIGNNVMQGIPVTRPVRIGAVRMGRIVRTRIGNWPSGLYFARLRAANGLVGFAPFVIRPQRLGEHRVAVVMPTLTWQAYNIRDEGGDGKGDTWYADWKRHTARLGRPYLNRGVPFNFGRWDLPVLHWLARNGHRVDYLADADLDSVARGRALADAYDLIVFPGHHEYVTEHEYDVVEQFRNLGGNLMFLSANNFFRRVDRRGGRIVLIGLWRDLGRPESELVGVQYRGNDGGTHRGPWIVRRIEAEPWLFAGTGLRDRMTFGNGGIEIDKTASTSPKGVHVLAEIPNLFGPGFTAQMTYYETARGAKVFAAGAFRFVTEPPEPQLSRLLGNLWARLSRP